MPRSFLKCFYFNSRSLKNKLSELHVLLHSSQYDIISVSETWLDETVSDELLLDGSFYTVFRADRRNFQTGGGTCVFVKSSLHVSEIRVKHPGSDVSADFNIEFVCLDIIGRAFKYRIFVCYIPPYWGSRSVENLNIFLSSIESLFICDASIVLMGDMNFPDIKWCKHELTPIECTKSVSSTFVDFISRYAFLQYVTDPTRADNLLDLVLCNDTFAVSDLHVECPFSTSDHNSVSFNLFFSDTSSDPYNGDRVKYNFGKARWDSIILQASEINWNERFANKRFEQLWDIFHNELAQIIERNVPVSGGEKGNRKIRYPKQIRKLQTRKLAPWRKWKETGSELNKTKYMQIAKECRQAIYNHILAREQDLIKANNLGGFYKYVNRKLSTKSGVGVLKDKLGNNVHDRAGQAGLLNEYFASNFTNDDGSLPTFASRVPDHVSLCYIPFDVESVSNALNKLRQNAAGGPDGLQPCFLKRISNFIAQPLSIMFEAFFMNAYIPPIWKMAFVKPIIKSGSSSLPSNYRPISLTCTCSKLMESIVSKHILQYLLENGLLSDQQCRFLPKRSTCLQLLDSFQDWILELSTNNQLKLFISILPKRSTLFRTINCFINYPLMVSNTSFSNGLNVSWGAENNVC